MVYVNDTACNGCGACVETCPTGALILQNSHAFIDQNLCQGCEICLDICPQGAIISGEMVPEAPTVIRMPEVHVQMASDEHLSLREMVLPVFGSFLLWMGRNLVPRLADAALGYLDQRVQSPPSRASQKRGLRGSGRASNSGDGNGRGLRRQRRCRNRRII